MIIMQDKLSTSLDFDEAVELARNDPAAFEQYRLDAIEALITRAPVGNRQKLRRLQWRIEQERRRAPNAIAACVKLYQMMWDSFAGEYGLIDALNNNIRNSPDGMNSRRSGARVLAFPGRTSPASIPIDRLP